MAAENQLPDHHRPDIEGLRGIAVLSVFAVHSMPDAVRGGFVGVDVFFVLSGYLIASIALRQQADARGALVFYARRLRRLLPALLVVLLACLLFAVVWALPADAKAIGKHVAAGAAFVSNLALWGEGGYFDQASELKPLLHLWSLGIEAQFYLLWPLLAWLLARSGRHASVNVLLVLGLSFGLNVLFVEAKPRAVFFLPPTRLWEMLVGVLLATWHQRVDGGPLATLGDWLPPGCAWRGRLADVFSGLGVLLLLLALTLTERTAHFPGWWALLPTLATFLILAAGMAAWLNRAVLALPLLAFYGRISYPLYLWHWPLLTFPLLLDRSLDTLEQIAVLTVAVALAVLTHFYVERPLSSGRWARHATPLLCAGVVLVLCLAGMLYFSDGLLARYPAPVRAIAAEHLRQDTTLIRLGTCFVNSAQERQQHAADCIAQEPATAPLAVLWGDSFSAALYPGLRALADSGDLGLRLAQFSGPLCPPLLRPMAGQLDDCAAMNAVALEQIRQLRPAVVILAGAWRTYAHPNGANEAAAARASATLQASLRDTIQRLHALGVARVVVIGTVPVWRAAQPRLLLGEWRRSGELPARMAEGLLPGLPALDESLAALAKDSGADYISALALLCNELGCEDTVAVDGTQHPMASDEGHLSAAGSRLLARRMLGVLRGTP